MPARLPGLAAVLVALIAAWPAPAAQPSGSPPMRDFPPLEDPDRPPERPAVLEPSAPVPPPSQTLPSPETESPEFVERDFGTYTLGVGDDIQISVLGEPEFTRAVRVLPNGSITTPVAGDIYVLGRSPDEVSREIERKLDRYLRHPRVDVIISAAREKMVYVMGEVINPGERLYRTGVTALQAIAQAGGVRSIGKANSVLVMRRTGRDDAVFHRIDVTEALEGKGKGEDMILEPYDIVYVPRSFIGSVGMFIDQYLRPALVPFNLYLMGWDAFHINDDNARLSGAR